MTEITQFNSKYGKGTIELISRILEDEFGFKVNNDTFPDIFHIRDKFQRNKGNFWVGLDRDIVVGSIGFLDFGNGVGYLKRMFLLKRLRGTGFAKELLDVLIRHAKKNTFHEIYLTTIPEMIAAMKFYEKNGFKRIKSLPKDLPTYGDHIFYQLTLD